VGSHGGRGGCALPKPERDQRANCFRQAFQSPQRTGDLHVQWVTGRQILSGRPVDCIGNASGFRVSRADLAAENIRSSSPWARTIVLEPGCGIYQDVSKIDLAAESDVSRYFYAPVHELFYQSLISSIDGKGSLRIALENSVNEEIYDETVLKGSSAQSSGPHLISLLARVPPLDQPSIFA